MKEVMLNLANWMLIEYCNKNSINCSNSFVAKARRGHTYYLCDYPTGKAFLSVTFSKNNAPQYWNIIK